VFNWERGEGTDIPVLFFTITDPPASIIAGGLESPAIKADLEESTKVNADVHMPLVMAQIWCISIWDADSDDDPDGAITTGAGQKGTKRRMTENGEPMNQKLGQKRDVGIHDCHVSEECEQTAGKFSDRPS
jgi:hypothetical protein